MKPSAPGAFSFAGNKSKNMKRNIFIFGSVLGVILCINMLYVLHLFYTSSDFESNDFLGYASQVVILSLIFFGIRNYRNKELGGYISFGKALKTGLLMLLVAATIYVGVWLFYYYTFVPDFLDRFIPHALKNVPASELPAKTREMEQFREMYKNPLFIILITYAEVVPAGLVVTLASALILKKKNKAAMAN